MRDTVDFLKIETACRINLQYDLSKAILDPLHQEMGSTCSTRPHWDAPPHPPRSLHGRSSPKAPCDTNQIAPVHFLETNMSTDAE